jgi:hypothetical protein
MKLYLKKLAAALGVTSMFILGASISSQAGNKDRIGQNGANQLTFNPWIRSSGFGNANSTQVRGLESIYTNVSGLAFVNRTELVYGFTNFMGGAVKVNAFGLAQKVGEVNTIAFSLMNMSFGEIDITTEDNPEGGIGTYSPQFLNLNFSFARAFSNSIYAGTNVKVINESITDVRASGVAFDLGIRYVTGLDDNLKFGIALKNIGPKLKYSGNGMDLKTSFEGKEFTFSKRAEAFEMPAELNIGVAYDIYIGPKRDTTAKSGKTDYRITPAGTFFSRAFGKDQVSLGMEAAWREMIMLRFGYLLEGGLSSEENRTNVMTGPTAGMSVELPLKKGSKSTIALDYSYRFTRPFSGNHAIGLRLSL